MRRVRRAGEVGMDERGGVRGNAVQGKRNNKGGRTKGGGTMRGDVMIKGTR